MTVYRTWRRLALALLVALPALLVLPAATTAAPTPGAVYEGTTSAGGTVRIVVNADETVSIAVQHPGVGSRCPASSLNASAVALAANGSQFTVASASTSDGRASMSGFLALPGSEVIAGAYIDEPSASACAPRVATWSASRIAPAVGRTAWPYAAGVTHRGSAYNVTGLRLGTAEFTTDANASVTIVVTASTGGCEYRTTQTAAFASREQLAGPSIAIATGTGGVTGVTSPSAIGGGFAIERTSPACAAVAGMWIASAPEPAPAVVAGAFASPPNFGTRFIALAVFSGGTAAQLEAAARAAGATGVWAQDASGAFVLLVVDGPSFINDPFRTRFAAGFATNTAVTLAR